MKIDPPNMPTTMLKMRKTPHVWHMGGSKRAPNVTTVGRFFLFREVRPRGDGESPVTWGFERAKNKGQGQIPLSQVTTQKIVPAKQPIIK
jgi:hypothetical protein